ncbi:hypothetical protein KBP51_11640 [Lactiplantibacillus pentosus]|uniref:DUF6483 family protein n=1 Tax=Lactiplantibacillus pentosus TaxID=1589 RepID=UPI001330374D|nr:DUF6483 family protein [Lactiplantibacillus pentosus]MBQ0837080.1 hypothetical protein [Lactiplantibacillus pentosus]
MQDESDWLMRQLRAFATGLGYTLSRRKGGETQVVFPELQDKPLPHQVELTQLIDKHAYAQAADRLLALQYAMTAAEFLKLGIWFYATLNRFDDQNLASGGISRASLVAGLAQLKQLDL